MVYINESKGDILDGRLDAILAAAVKNNGELFVIVTKAPHLLLQRDLPRNVVVHCTITGLGGSVIEPGVQTHSYSIEAYRKLVSKYGGERVVLRVDPILPWGDALAMAYNIAFETNGRLRVSFLDMYPHVRERFNKAGVYIPEDIYEGGIHANIKVRREILYNLPELTEVCGEPGVVCDGCISARDFKAVGLAPTAGKSNQRPACACVAAKKEILPHTQCRHKCLYCYWKDSVAPAGIKTTESVVAYTNAVNKTSWQYRLYAGGEMIKEVTSSRLPDRIKEKDESVGECCAFIAAAFAAQKLGYKYIDVNYQYPSLKYWIEDVFFTNTSISKWFVKKYKELKIKPSLTYDKSKRCK